MVSFAFAKTKRYQNLVIMRIPKKAPDYLLLITDVLLKQPDIIRRSLESPARDIIHQANNEAWNWEDCSYRAHLSGMNAPELWALVKLSRLRDRYTTPLFDSNRKPFTYRLPPAAHRILHRIDSDLGGSIGSPLDTTLNEDEKNRFLLTSLREEAISSSMIEGAVSTRKEADEMIRSKRKPKTIGERMILNNYTTIQFLNRQKHEVLTPEIIMQVQRTLIHNTLEHEDAAGRLRYPVENIKVYDEDEQQILHQPPPAEELSERIAKMCAFANASTILDVKTDFIHPAIRAIILHFWLAYDHPFVDGNGRTARALFYWCMLKNGYWLAEFLTISTIIAGHPKKYARAYLDTEIDDNDLTYYIMYHLDVIERSINVFRDYIREKQSEQSRFQLVQVSQLNPRQQALLIRALKDPLAIFTYESHSNSHGVTIYTARNDLLNLEKLGLLRGNRKGRQFEFTPAPNISDVLKKLAS